MAEEVKASAHETVREARDAALDALATVGDLESLDAWRTAELGKKGRLNALMREIPNLPNEERPVFGQAVNAAKGELEAAFGAARDRLRASALEAELAAEAIDVTLPGDHPPHGGLHPSTRIMRRIQAVSLTH